MIKCQPIKPAMIMTATIVQTPAPPVYRTPRPMAAIKAKAFNTCPPGNLKGVPLKRPANLPKATIEPVNVTAPMKIPKKTSIFKIVISTAFFDANFLAKPVNSFRSAFDASNRLTFSSSNSALRPMKTAANPTKLCKAATNWGISVISTRLATISPKTAPIVIVITIMI